MQNKDLVSLGHTKIQQKSILFKKHYILDDFYVISVPIKRWYQPLTLQP